MFDVISEVVSEEGPHCEGVVHDDLTSMLSCCRGFRPKKHKFVSELTDIQHLTKKPIETQLN